MKTMKRMMSLCKKISKLLNVSFFVTDYAIENSMFTIQIY